jgi:hypothetical protein
MARYLVDMPPGGKARARRLPKLPSCAAYLDGIAFESVNMRAQDLRAACARPAHACEMKLFTGALNICRQAVNCFHK